MKNVLVIMPYGKKSITINNFENYQIDYDKDYKNLEKKLKKPDISIFRVDNLFHLDIFKKMYKSIHSADIVIADITGLNPNVFYELGIRHSLRKSTTILICNKKRYKNVDFKIPFDISTYSVIDYSELFEKWDFILTSSNNYDDSPVLKEINSLEEDKKVFEDYVNQWNIFWKEMDKIDSKNNKKRISLNKKYIKYFDGVEKFNQNYAKNLYYNKEDDEVALLKAWDVIEKINPFDSNDQETIGLACSISRKIYELTKDKIWKLRAFNLSRYFISKNKSAYAFSSYALYFISIFENEGLDNFEYLKYEFNQIYDLMTFKKHKSSSENEEEDKWWIDTEKLIKDISNFKVSYQKDNFYNETSWKAYSRWINIYNQNKKGGDY